jgi:hypothetical protein
MLSQFIGFYISFSYLNKGILLLLLLLFNIVRVILQCVYSVVVQEGVNGLESWRLAGANLGQGDYCGRTAMHVVHSPSLAVFFALRQVFS